MLQSVSAKTLLNFSVTSAIYVDEFFAHIFFINHEAYIERNNFIITSSECWASINVT